MRGPAEWKKLARKHIIMRPVISYGVVANIYTLLVRTSKSM